MPLNAQIYAGIQATLNGAAIAGSSPTWSKMLAPLISFTDGSGDNQASKLLYDLRTLASGAAEDIDIRASNLDPLGGAAPILTLKVLEFISDPNNTTDLSISGDANSVPFFGAANDVIVVKPGGRLLLVAPKTGYTVTNLTGDILQVANAAGAAATYSYCILGT